MRKPVGQPTLLSGRILPGQAYCHPRPRFVATGVARRDNARRARRKTTSTLSSTQCAGCLKFATGGHPRAQKAYVGLEPLGLDLKETAQVVPTIGGGPSPDVHPLYRRAVLVLCSNVSRQGPIPATADTFKPVGLFAVVGWCGCFHCAHNPKVEGSNPSPAIGESGS